ncbi:MAG: fructose transporter subunit [Sporomusa sp.]|jgi:PTS system fructose-specific IIB component|nr:fructose transporter subunit [Sporomusa sp.]
MNIVGITACTAGIAHTYVAKEKFVNAAKKLGHKVKVETQGTIGTQNALTKQDIEEADVVIIAADIEILGKERFNGKKLVEVPISTIVKTPETLIKKIQEKLNL